MESNEMALRNTDMQKRCRELINDFLQYFMQHSISATNSTDPVVIAYNQLLAVYSDCIGNQYQSEQDLWQAMGKVQFVGEFLTKLTSSKMSEVSEDDELDEDERLWKQLMSEQTAGLRVTNLWAAEKRGWQQVQTETALDCALEQLQQGTPLSEVDNDIRQKIEAVLQQLQSGDSIAVIADAMAMDAGQVGIIQEWARKQGLLK